MLLETENVLVCDDIWKKRNNARIVLHALTGPSSNLTSSFLLLPLAQSGPKLQPV